jgi:hypothetical protein
MEKGAVAGLAGRTVPRVRCWAAGRPEHLAARGGLLCQDPAVEAVLMLGRWLRLGQAEAPARQEPCLIERIAC